MKISQVLLVMILFISSWVQAQEEKAILEILKNMSYEDKLRILEFAKQQEAIIDEEILNVMSKLPKSNKREVIEYAISLTEHTGHNHVEVEGLQIEPPKNQPTTTIEFEKSYINFGTVREGQIVEKKYTFKNTGNEPLTIVNAQGSCGCTVPEWPQKPIPPGGVGTIRVRFNTLNKPGKRSQNVVITANTDPIRTTLTLQGVVEKDK